MSTNCKLYLPSTVRLKDVLTVLSRAVGHKIEKVPFSSGSSSWYAKSDGAYAKPLGTNDHEMLYLTWSGGRMIPWTFEGDGGTRLLFPLSTPFMCALCKKLVEFFGGELIYDESCDEDDVENVLRVKPKPTVDPKDDSTYEPFQKRLSAVTPLTMDDINEGKIVSAYDHDHDHDYLFDRRGFLCIPRYR